MNLTVRLVLLLLVGATGGVFADAPAKDAIKGHKYEVRAVPYNDNTHADPFRPLVPLKTVESAADWKVRIASLRLSSVIVGRGKVAIFNELHGPVYSYILVNGVLLGPDRKPVPGVAGLIEPNGRPGEFRVTLRQGAEKVEYTMRNLELQNRKTTRTARPAQGGSGSTGTRGGGS